MRSHFCERLVNDYGALASWVQPDDYLIAADGGGALSGASCSRMWW